MKRSMQILYAPYPDDLVSEVLRVFFRSVQTMGENQESVVIGLSGGTSLLLFYEAMRDNFPSLETRLRSKIRFVFLDERLVPLDHPDSNYRLLSETLFAPLLENNLLEREQILTVRTDMTDSAVEYSSRVPRIDIGLFGAGPDGHIASLFPNHPGLQDESEGYILVHNSPKPPSDRISVSVPYVQRIPSVFLFFIGEGKRGAYNQFLDPSIKEEQCPARYLLACENLVVVTDLEE